MSSGWARPAEGGQFCVEINKECLGHAPALAHHLDHLLMSLRTLGIKLDHAIDHQVEAFAGITGRKDLGTSWQATNDGCSGDALQLRLRHVLKQNLTAQIRHHIQPT